MDDVSQPDVSSDDSPQLFDSTDLLRGFAGTLPEGIDRSMLRQKYGWVESFSESLKAWFEIDILREQCHDIPGGVSYPGSSEVIESLIGKYKPEPRPLVPGLCPGTHCPSGSACTPRTPRPSTFIREQREPQTAAELGTYGGAAMQCVPGQSPGTRYEDEMWGRLFDCCSGFHEPLPVEIAGTRIAGFKGFIMSPLPQIVCVLAYCKTRQRRRKRFGEEG